MIEIFTQTPWQMTLGERSALEGVLASLKPRLAVEIGTAEGGSLRRIAAHSTEVHSFDLVEPSLPVHEWGDVTLHTGDSHALLPAFLAERAQAGENVDFVLVDGDHSADGVRRDLEDLLASPAIGRTAILIHDTLNDEVRRGLEAVDYFGSGKVARVELDFVGGHLSQGGPYDLQLWGGIGLVLVDAGAPATGPDPDAPVFFALPELLVPVRDAMATGADPEAELAATRAELAALEHSLSWRLTAPLRTAKRRALARRRG